ncbi:ornithine monooxygenase [Ophiocordyceps camponoti-floridani]|uniref:L-ornithine N(5)-monooxygenase [NAD(P)H] n=1 Tax=Ophiocordyceps camponoti-floridani TaxID=2030778 RepID=A0A8H4QDV4_9HYPO|nr:ornithine monooxygenase [Ophiocordyceps camponoti-floridani]
MSPHSDVVFNDSGGIVNGVSRQESRPAGTQPPSPYLTAECDDDGCYDVVCVGFGPASLAVAIAMHDALAGGRQLVDNGSPRVLFIEKQTGFAWHAGMLLPGAKMQISFVKDLATLRDPRSRFTFLNYLHCHGRLVDFTNLGTFLPARVEYEDYLRWCASHFDHLVRFGEEAVSVEPVAGAYAEPVRSFSVIARDVVTGQTHTYRGRNVLLATGGQPSVPPSLPLSHPRIVHSSAYGHRIHHMLPKTAAAYRIAVVGAGQSAAEIFHNLPTRYPNARTWLVMRPEFLRPSDDSPFVNSVFNPEYIDCLFPKSARDRNSLLAGARATNYGVVRLSLIEELYERMYDQKRRLGADETQWPHRILGGRRIARLESPRTDSLTLKLRRVGQGDDRVQNGSGEGVSEEESEEGEEEEEEEEEEQETLDVDVIVAATGYQRNAHVQMLRAAWDMLPEAHSIGKTGTDGWAVETDGGARTLTVGRDYGIKFRAGTVAADSGVWLQGCCEGTHGLSDTLLSVLATRSGEIVDSIFGGKVVDGREIS